MRNWCVGELIIRGKFENITQFLIECIDDIEVRVNIFGNLEIENIKRQLIKGVGVVFCNNVNNTTIKGSQSSEGFIVNIPIIVAGVLVPSVMVVLSKHFNVDFSFYGVEKEMQFNQKLKVIKGELTLDKYIEFGNYVCVRPCSTFF